MNTIRDKPKHEQRRRIWDLAFSVKGMDSGRDKNKSYLTDKTALGSYEGRVIYHIDKLDQSINSSLGRAIDVTKLFGFFSFDVMGDLSFGKQFGMLESEKEHFAVNTLRQGMLALGLFTPAPWLFVILITTPGLMRGWNKMIDWSIGEVTHRINVCEPIMPVLACICFLVVLSQSCGQHEPKVPDVSNYP